MKIKNYSSNRMYDVKNDPTQNINAFKNLLIDALYVDEDMAELLSDLIVGVDERKILQFIAEYMYDDIKVPYWDKNNEYDNNNLIESELGIKSNEVVFFE